MEITQDFIRGGRATSGREVESVATQKNHQHHTGGTGASRKSQAAAAYRTPQREGGMEGMIEKEKARLDQLGPSSLPHRQNYLLAQNLPQS